MHQDLPNLFALQQLDITVRERETAQQQLPQALNIRQAAHTERQTAHAALAAQVEQLEQESRQLYQSVEVERDKVRKWEARLGDIRNQREFQALQRETEGQRRANRASEERLAELSRQHEQLQADAQAQAETLKGEGDGLAKEAKDIAAKVQTLETELKDMRLERDKLAKDVSSLLLRRYEAIRARRQGVGMSVIKGGSCVSCHMRLPPQLYNILQRGDSVEQCPSCSRIMIWSQALPGAAEEAKEPEEAVEAPKPKTRAKSRKTSQPAP